MDNELDLYLTPEEASPPPIMPPPEASEAIEVAAKPSYKEQVTEELKKDQREDLSDLTGLSPQDYAWQFGTAGIADSVESEEIDDLVGGDMTDLFEVKREDVIGSRPKPKQRPIRLSRRYQPPTSMTGIQ